MVLVLRAGALVAAALLLFLATACGQFQSSQAQASVPAASETSLTGVVTQTTKVWKEPAADDTAVLGQIAAGTTVKLRAHNPDTTWYIVEAPDGLIGWVRAPQMTIEKSVAAHVPVNGTSTCNCGAHADND